MGSLKNERSGLRHICKAWPLFAAVTVGSLNIDLVIIPLFLRRGLAGLKLFGIASILSTIELVFWYWFWGWLIKTTIGAKDVQESIKFSKQIGNELKKEGYIDRIKNFFLKKFYWAFNRRNMVIKAVKAGGVLSLILLGAWPEPTTRFIGVVFCRTVKSRKGFCFLAVGNILHLAYIVDGWSFIFSLFKK